MDKQTYTQRVQALAEEIAHSVFHERFSTLQKKYTKKKAHIEHPLPSIMQSADKLEQLHWQERYVSKCLPAARIAVAEMAEAYKAGWCEIYDFSNDPEFGPDIQKGLITLGLIPDNAQEGGKS